MQNPVRSRAAGMQPLLMRSVFLHRTTVAIAYSAMSFAVRDSAMCLSRARIQLQKSFCDSSYATTFASARFQHIPTQSCCMLSFKIGSLRRAS